MSLIKNWLKEPHLQQLLSRCDFSVVLCFFRFDSVGFNYFHMFLCGCVLLAVAGRQVYKMVNKCLLEWIEFKTRKLEYNERKLRQLDNGSRRTLSPTGKKAALRKGGGSDAP